MQKGLHIHFKDAYEMRPGGLLEPSGGFWMYVNAPFDDLEEIADKHCLTMGTMDIMGNRNDKLERRPALVRNLGEIEWNERFCVWSVGHYVHPEGTPLSRLYISFAHMTDVKCRIAAANAVRRTLGNTTPTPMWWHSFMIEMRRVNRMLPASPGSMYGSYL